MIRFLFLLAFLSTSAFAADRVIINPDVDGDLKLKVNDNGTVKDAISVTGSTALTTIGVSGESGTQSINGNFLSVTGGGATDKGPSLWLKSTYTAGGTHASVYLTPDNASLYSTDMSGISGQDAGELRFIRGDGGSSYSTNGLISGAGSWTLGPSGYTGSHRLNGTLGINTVPDGSHKLQVLMPSSGYGVNFRYSGGTNNPGLWIGANESSTDVSLDASGSTSANLVFLTDGVEAGRVSSARNWTLGPHASGSTLTLKKTTDVPSILFEGGTKDFTMEAGNFSGTGYMKVYNPDPTPILQGSESGSWTIGPASSSTGVYQTIRGRSNLTTAGVATLNIDNLYPTAGTTISMMTQGVKNATWYASPNYPFGVEVSTGTDVAWVNQSGDWSLGASASAGNHTLYGKTQIYSSHATNIATLSINSRGSSTYADLYIDSNTGYEPRLFFERNNSELGRYYANGAYSGIIYSPSVGDVAKFAASGNVTLGSSGYAGTHSVIGNMATSGAITQNGAGGNTPHNCVLSSVGSRPANALYTLDCGSGWAALGGGANCASPGSVSKSYPATTHSWAAECTSTFEVHVICCRL